MSNITPDAWIERQPEDEPHRYLCSHCESYQCHCDEYDELTEREEDEEIKQSRSVGPNE